LQQLNQTEPRDIVPTCQAVSPMDEPCDATGTYVHAEDEVWHHCALKEGDNGGEV
jgi:hypothetical protein